MSFSSEDDGDRARLRRYRDAQCESEFETYPEPVIARDGRWRCGAVALSTLVVGLFWVGLIVLRVHH